MKDIRISFNNYLQDIGPTSNLKYTNECLVKTEAGETIQAIITDPIKWTWNRLVQNSDGEWGRVFLSNAFSLKPSDVWINLCNGVFILELVAFDEVSGKEYSNYLATYCLFNFPEAEALPCPNIMPYPQYLSAEDWVALGLSSTWQTPWVTGMDLKKGKVGDMNGDGINNITDVLLFLSTQGK